MEVECKSVSGSGELPPGGVFGGCDLPESAGGDPPVEDGPHIVVVEITNAAPKGIKVKLTASRSEPRCSV